LGRIGKIGHIATRRIIRHPVNRPSAQKDRDQA